MLIFIINIFLSYGFIFHFSLSQTSELSTFTDGLDLSKISIISKLNISSDDLTISSKEVVVKGKIILNDLYWYSIFDFTREIYNYTCNPSICRIQFVSISSCEYNYYLQFATCSQCNKKMGCFCMYDSSITESILDDISNGYTILNSKVQGMTNSYIQSVLDYEAMLKFIQYSVPFYFFYFKDNMNDYYKKIDLINSILFKHTNYKNFNPFATETLEKSKKFLSDMLYQSFFSFEFDYISFIELFLNNTNYAKEPDLFQYGRNSTTINPFGNQTVHLGNTSIISELALIAEKGINYGSMGYPDLNNTIQITFPKALSQKLFDTYIKVDILNKWINSLDYVVTFIHNHNAYYVKGGIKPVTPIVGISLFKKGSTYERYKMPKGNTNIHNIEIKLSWSFERMNFYFGEMKSNCNVVKWNQIAKAWFPSFFSYIDVEKSNENIVTFYVNDFGIYAIDCDYYIQRKLL